MCFGTHTFKFWSMNNLFDKHKLEQTELDPSKFVCKCVILD